MEMYHFSIYVREYKADFVQGSGTSNALLQYCTKP